MTEHLPEDATVTYSVKQLLADIKKDQTEGFARVEKGLETKANQAHVVQIEQRVDQHAEQIGELQEFRRTHERTVRRRWSVAAKLWAATGVGVTAFAAIVAALIAHYGI